MAKIGDVFSLIRNGANIKQGDDDSGFPITRIETIANRVIDRNRMGYAGITNISKYESYVLQDGDILMSHINSEAHLGKVALYDKRQDEIIIHGMNLLCLRPKIEILNPRYAYYYFSSGAFLRQLPNITKKSVNQASFNISALKELNIAVPNMKKQNQITKVLNAIEVLVQMRLKQLSHLDQLVKSQFIEMFGDLALNTKGYPIKKLNDISEYWNGLTYKPTDTVEDGEGTLVLRSSNIQNGELAFDDNVYVNCNIKEKLFVKDNDILMCSRNGSAALVGKTAIIKDLKEPTTFGAFMMIIRSKYYRYLKTYFEMPFFRSQISTGTSTINQITGRMLNKVELPVPDMDTVHQFESVVEQADKSKFAIQQSLEQLETLKKSLMQEYFG